MKLALIRRRFSATGGAELYLQRLLGALVGAGHEVHLLAEVWANLPSEAHWHRLAPGGGRGARPARFADAVETELARGSFDCVFSLERTRRQDVYRAGDGVHQVWLQRRREFAPWWKRPWIGFGAFHRNVLALERQTFDPTRTRRIIVNSEMVRGEILRQFHFPPDRIHLVRNGVDLARFRGGKRDQTRTRFGVRSDEFLLLFVGSGHERKGFPFLLRLMADLNNRETEAKAAGTLRPAKLLVVGKDRPPIAGSAGIIFAGPMDDVENAYAAADLLVFLPIYDPSANVIPEALAAGLPVVTSAQNGASELIEPGVNGQIIPNPADHAAVLAAVHSWMGGPDGRRVKLGADVSLERNVTETLAVLELAASERAK